MTNRGRLNKALELMRQKAIDYLIVGSPANFYYLTGKWIDPHERLLALVLKQKGDPVVLSPEMHRNDFEAFEWGCLFWHDGEDAVESLSRQLSDSCTIAVDHEWSSGNLLSLMKMRSEARYVGAEDVLTTLRQIKDSAELSIIREAGKRTDRVMESLIRSIVPGMRELELAEMLRGFWGREGVREQSFPPIIASGANGASPHHVTGEVVLRGGDMVILDIGGRLQHYCSDVTRTIAVGEPSAEMLEVYGLVKCAQQEGLKRIKPGVPFAEVDKAVRDVIAAGGYASYFTHRTGHGLGIELHELPSVQQANKGLIEEGMVFSVEPGIYLPGQFGVRIEDIVIVTEAGCEPVTTFTKELIVRG